MSRFYSMSFILAIAIGGAGVVGCDSQQPQQGNWPGRHSDYFSGGNGAMDSGVRVAGEPDSVVHTTPVPPTTQPSGNTQ